MSEEKNEVNLEAPDYLLQDLVMLANNIQLSMGITLFAGGVVVSGLLIGGQEYFQIIKESINSETCNSESVKEGFTTVFDEYSKIYSEPPSEPQPPTYIHLKEAKVFAHGQTPIPNNGILWRGRISRIEGFSFGAFQPI